MDDIIHHIQVALNSLKKAEEVNDRDLFIGELETLETYCKEQVDELLGND